MCCVFQGSHDKWTQFENTLIGGSHPLNPDKPAADESRCRTNTGWGVTLTKVRGADTAKSAKPFPSCLRVLEYSYLGFSNRS